MASSTSAANASASKNTVTLTDNSNGQSWEMPIMEGSLGPRVIDVRRLYADTGFFTYDPGYTSTASCESTLTHSNIADKVLPKVLSS